jgi:antitoxin MazE
MKGETIMKIKVVRIGNSRGIRIPKPLIQQTGMGDEVEIEVVDNRLIISATGAPRANWEKSFKAMAEAGDDQLLDGEELRLTQFEEGEWDW